MSSGVLSLTVFCICLLSKQELVELVWCSWLVEELRQMPQMKTLTMDWKMSKILH